MNLDSGVLVKMCILISAIFGLKKMKLVLPRSCHFGVQKNEASAAQVTKIYSCRLPTL